MSIKQIKSMLQFSRGGSLVWEALVTPVPDNVVAFSIDDGVFKLGDGVTLYKNLPVLFTFNELISVQGGISGLFEEPAIAQNGNIVVIGFDPQTNTTSYAISNTKLVDFVNSISAIETTNTAQDAAIAELMEIALSLDASINTAGNNNVVVITDGRYTSSGTTLSGVQSQISAQITYTPGSHLEDALFYSDAGKTIPADKYNLIDGATYYVDLVGFNNNVVTPTFGLTSPNTNVVVTALGGASFRVQMNGVTGTQSSDIPVILIASVDNGLGTSTIRKAVTTLVQAKRIILATYGGSADDSLTGIAIDKNDNVFAVGYTASEGTGNDALIVKYDASLNILAKKRFGGTNGDYFWGVAVDSLNNVIAVGQTVSEGTSGSALVVKFDNNLAILLKKYLDGSSADVFKSIVVDSANNIYAVGTTTTEGTSGSSLIVKFDSNLNVLFKKYYGGTGSDAFNKVCLDKFENPVVCGSEGATTSAIVIKFDPSLNIIARKIITGVTTPVFNGVTVDTDNNVFCVGTSGSGSLILKFDQSFVLIAQKIYGAANDEFKKVIVDKDDNVIAVGSTKYEGLGTTTYMNCAIVKFDNDLNIIGRKVCGGTNHDAFQDVAIDSNSNIFCGAYEKSEGAGNYDFGMVRFSKGFPVGTFSGVTFTNFQFVDSARPMVNATLTVADSAQTLTNSTLTLSTSTVPTLADSNLTAEREVIN